ncbi:hypothetical protein NP493_1329g00003 [Ridgeia piscesae]|uniref:BTB domain-containing protein n=1 Tax=Ridgeia piscesae TaxID=27915 RepID=A0AAD9K7B8_RIDPI|nr:hypothetical protein NP493_1329g00003 [Ridgeia piscesae]
MAMSSRSASVGVSSPTSMGQLNLMFMEQMRQDLHVVKCVVVGDTGVGKTRLICSRACGTRYSLPQLSASHVPTVWAIDQYRKSQQVLEKSWGSVDGVSVLLQLWDTFGYHDKDRRFAYGRADVIVVCFSVVRPHSLRSVLSHWYPEIQRISPGVPIILCGTQIDLRYLYTQEEFLKIDKGPFFREIHDSDILLPERGQIVAKEMGAYYYETSVLVPYGVDYMFMNALRAALLHKRDKHIWNVLGSLKRIQKPTCQAPFQPPRPLAPLLVSPAEESDSDLWHQVECDSYCDVVFVTPGGCVSAHAAYLVTASSVFQRLLLTPGEFLRSHVFHGSSQNMESRNMNVTCTDWPAPQCDTVETSSGIGVESLDRSSENREPQQTFLFNHPVFQTLETQPFSDPLNNDGTNWRTVIHLGEAATLPALTCVLRYLYTGQLGSDDAAVLLDVQTLADLLGMPQLVAVVTNIRNHEEFLNSEVLKTLHATVERQTQELLIERGLLADVWFQVDDGLVAGHKALLTARSEVMAHMFGCGHFRECSAKLATRPTRILTTKKSSLLLFQIQFPGVTRDTFLALLYYLYTGQRPLLVNVDCVELIELANRLCLPRLLALTERHLGGCFNGCGERRE